MTYTQNQLEWRAIAISELIDLLYLLSSDPELKPSDFRQRLRLLLEAPETREGIINANS